jgi:hypothetical protein
MATVFGLLLHCLVILAAVSASHGSATQHPPVPRTNDTLISQKLFWELEELARIVDISYCVGTAGLGIQKPFQCASHCSDRDFESFELVTVSCPWQHFIVETLLTIPGMEYGSFLV